MADGSEGSARTKLVMVEDQMSIRTIFDEGEVWAGMLKKVTDGRYAGVTREEVPRSEVMLKDGILDERMRPGESIVAKVSCRLSSDILTGTWVDSEGWEASFSAALSHEASV